MSLVLPDLAAHRGRWVGVDTATGEVVESSRTHDELLAALGQSPPRRVVIHRVPMQDEPIFVGLA